MYSQHSLLPPPRSDRRHSGGGRDAPGCRTETAATQTGVAARRRARLRGGPTEYLTAEPPRAAASPNDQPSYRLRRGDRPRCCWCPNLPARPGRQRAGGGVALARRARRRAGSDGALQRAARWTRRSMECGAAQLSAESSRDQGAWPRPKSRAPRPARRDSGVRIRPRPQCRTGTARPRSLAAPPPTAAARPPRPRPRAVTGAPPPPPSRWFRRTMSRP